MQPTDDLITLLNAYLTIEGLMFDNILLGCPLEIGDVPFDTNEFNFTSQLNVAREGFTGRQWLYHNIESLLLDSEGDRVPGVVVVGEPGAGKSALSAQLICSRSSNPYIHKRILGYHLCKHSDKATQDPGRFVRNLVDLIARRIPQYGMLIYKSSFILKILERRCLRDPYECFEQAVVAPLHRIQLEDEIPNYFFVVDALDECSDRGDSGSSMVYFIKESYERLPSWIHLILTSRNDPKVLKHFSSFPKLNLSSTDSRNLEDIEIFITTKTFENPSWLKLNLGFGSREEFSNLTGKLLHQSQGNFLFAKEMLLYLRKDPHGVDLNKLPNTIGEQYQSYLRRAFRSREQFKSARAILEVLVSSFEPLKYDRLFDVLKIREKIEYENDFDYTMKSLSHFISYGIDNTVSLFHLSFQEWLTSPQNHGGPYYVSRSRGHVRLSEYYMALVKLNPNSSEDIYRLAQHITFDENGEKFLDEFRAIDASFINSTIDNENRTLLHLAANRKNAKALKLLGSSFHDIDCEDKYGFTPAFVAFVSWLKLNLGFGSREEFSNLTGKLLHQSQGNFLFAKEMLLYLRKDPHGVDLNKLPNTIGEQYQSYLRRAFRSREQFKSARAILEVLVSSFEPLKYDRLFDVLKIREKIEYENDFDYTMKSLSHFISYGIDNTVSLFHLSFQEWLTSPQNHGGPYYVSRSRGHVRLSEYYMALVKLNPNSSEDIYRLAQHITFDENGEKFLDEFRAIDASFINSTIDNENRTLLHLAANRKNAKALKLLGSSFHDIDCEDKYGFTPAFVASINGLLENVDLLLRQGANMEHRTKPPPLPNSFSWDPIERSKTVFWNSTMMHVAAAGGHSKVVLLLLERNASFTGLNAVNLTAIELAAENGHLEVVKILYERGARLHHLSLQHAAFNGHTDVVEFIQSIGVVDRCMRCDGSFYWLGNKTRYQTASPNTVGYILSDDRFKILCQSALHLAVAKNHTKVVNRLLLEDSTTNLCTDFTGRTPLHEAVRQNHVEIAELLIKHGARIRRKCSFFQNFSGPDVSKTRRRNHLSEKELLEYEKDLCHCGSTPFLLAARYGHIEVANLLLLHGARPEVMDCFGTTPLLEAACHGHHEFKDWLNLQRPRLKLSLSIFPHSGAICSNNKDIKPR